MDVETSEMTNFNALSVPGGRERPTPALLRGKYDYEIRVRRCACRIGRKSSTKFASRKSAGTPARGFRYSWLLTVTRHNSCRCFFNVGEASWEDHFSAAVPFASVKFADDGQGKDFHGVMNVDRATLEKAPASIRIVGRTSPIRRVEPRNRRALRHEVLNGPAALVSLRDCCRNLLQTPSAAMVAGGVFCVSRLTPKDANLAVKQ